MMLKTTTILFGLLLSSVALFAQQWQQTAGTPEGAGVTELVVRQSNGHVFVTTASFNWPSGDDGGVRRSTDGGASWTNLFDAYSGRTITDAMDGNLYASLWPYPQDEGVYRSTNNGDTWDLLVTVPSENNIFSIAVNTNSKATTIFAGTRQGVYRSPDNGATWAYANNGISSPSWVRDMEVDNNGNVAAATYTGLYISTNNGDLWQEVSGAGIDSDTIVKLGFDYPNTTRGNDARLQAGSNNGSLYESFENANYLTATLMALFDGESSGIATGYLAQQNLEMHGVSFFPTNRSVGGFSSSVDGGATWQENNEGLPPTLFTSALSAAPEDPIFPFHVQFFIGLFNNSNSGAQVYTRTFEIAIGINDFSSDLSSNINLYQNYPNPFSKSTTFKYELNRTGKVNISIYNHLGILLETLVNEDQQTGNYEVSWNSESLESGIYFYRLQLGDQNKTGKMVLMKN